MSSGLISVSAQVGSLQWQATTTDSGGGDEGHHVALPVAQAATITSGVLTFSTAHGFGGTERLAIFGAFGRRYGVTISTHDTLTVTLNSDGAGDALPTGGAAVTVSVGQAMADVNFDGDNMTFLLAVCDQIACVEFLATASVVGHMDVSLVGNGYGYYWSYLSGVTRPVTGAAVTTAYAYNKAVTAATLDFRNVMAT